MVVIERRSESVTHCIAITLRVEPFCVLVMKHWNLLVFVVVNESPPTLVKDDVVIAPAEPLFVISRTIEHIVEGGASVKAPPFVIY